MLQEDNKNETLDSNNDLSTLCDAYRLSFSWTQTL